MLTPVQLTYGPMFIGVMFNIMLYGVMITQTYLYFNMYKDDRVWIKVFVLVLLFCDTLNTAFDIALLYEPLINKFGESEALGLATWMFATDPAMTAIIAALVQLFFAWRVNVLTSNRLIVGFIVVCAITQLCGGLGCSIAIGIIPQFSEFRKFQVVGIIWLVGAALADLLITTALVWYLRKHKSGILATDDLVNKIIRLTVQTGLITSLFAVMSLVLYLAVEAGWDFIFNMPLAKLYTNSLMSTLNSRRIWTATTNGSDTVGHSGPASGANVKIFRSDEDRRRSAGLSGRIVIGVESHQMTDFSDMKDSDHHYAPSAMTFVRPDEKTLSPVVEEV
ncbi:hypothetical protein GSI_02414 [Ganoderma sinense ZZ0214-1]|uniref:DUF6534 domain-containing protein n=1 Tax=Ganoderma sinense ZZ0214-1 TaxID=1077348 RepID=A0A2G8SPJ1_9APHY|nr:hypothetical protein GSI_02414 [Ganoderma sinense ZZ0214-1]